MGQGFLAFCPEFAKETVVEPVAVKEVNLDPYEGRSFDGASRVDMVLLLERNRGVPFEIKLGTTRLSRSRITDEWLRGCAPSEQPGLPRWTGNMMSILDRRFPAGTANEHLWANFPNGKAAVRRVMLTESWFVIARQEVIRKLQIDRPVFNAQFISFESIVEAFEGNNGVRGQKFNSLIRRLLAVDFYESWIRGSAE